MQCTIRADPHRLHSGPAMLPSAVPDPEKPFTHSVGLPLRAAAGTRLYRQCPHTPRPSSPFSSHKPIPAHVAGVLRHVSASRHIPLAWMAFRRAKLGVSSKCRRRMPVTGQVRLPAASHRSMHRRSYVWPAVQKHCSEEMQVSAVQCMCCCAQACSPRS